MIHERITMLGTTGAGKTCFLVGMYADISGGRRGFTFSTNPDDDLDLSGKWDRLIEAGPDRWPAPTGDQPKSYTFGFNYGLRRIMEFDWIDYRGGALLDRSTEADVQELKRYLRQSSCVMLCVSGEHLQEPKKAAVVRAQTGIGRMNSFLTDLREELERQKRELPAVIIVITKSDYCSKRPREEIEGQIRDLFNPLFARDEGWLVSIGSVSLGTGLATDAEKGEIDPDNIHLPLVFSIYRVLHERAGQQQSKLSKDIEQLTEIETEWGSLKRWWRSEEIEQILRETEEDEQKLVALQKDLQLLVTELTELREFRVYYDGKEVEYGGEEIELEDE